MLRKAVLMPKWAILLTILGSVAGQQVSGGQGGIMFCSVWRKSAWRL